MPSPKGYVLSEADRQALKETVAKVRNMVDNAVQRPSYNMSDLNEQQGPETYLATVTADITARSGDVPGQGTVEINVILDSDDSPNISSVTDFTKTVFNYSTGAIDAGETVLITRDKYGRWYCITAGSTTASTDDEIFDFCLPVAGGKRIRKRPDGTAYCEDIPVCPAGTANNGCPTVWVCRSGAATEVTAEEVLAGETMYRTEAEAAEACPRYITCAVSQYQVARGATLRFGDATGCCQNGTIDYDYNAATSQCVVGNTIDAGGGSHASCNLPASGGTQFNVGTCTVSGNPPIACAGLLVFLSFNWNSGSPTSVAGTWSYQAEIADCGYSTVTFTPEAGFGWVFDGTSKYYKDFSGYDARLPAGEHLIGALTVRNTAALGSPVIGTVNLYLTETP